MIKAAFVYVIRIPLGVFAKGLRGKGFDPCPSLIFMVFSSRRQRTIAPPHCSLKGTAIAFPVYPLLVKLGVNINAVPHPPGYISILDPYSSPRSA